MSQVIYRGPGDNFVPNHPGNAATHGVIYVWLERAPPRPKLGRVMVDLARVVLKVLPCPLTHPHTCTPTCMQARTPTRRTMVDWHQGYPARHGASLTPAAQTSGQQRI